uniref:Uncharacterized protein n=1 Tax=Anguilla anguilla TaxID=7936 RepID=A0A0E9Q3I2_ANGAN
MTFCENCWFLCVRKN